MVCEGWDFRQKYFRKILGMRHSGMHWAFRANTGHPNEPSAAHYVAPMQEDAMKDLLAHQRNSNQKGCVNCRKSNRR